MASNGTAIVTVSQDLASMVWVVYQLGFALNEVANFAQAGAQVNGVPLATTIVMQPSPFSEVSGFGPFAMLGYMVGPPYILLSTSDSINVGITGAVSGDTFTVAAYVDELTVAEAEQFTMAGTYLG